MCLDSVTTNNPDIKSGFGWKCFARYGDDLITSDKGCIVHMEEWNENAHSPRLQSENGKCYYTSGYHIWATKEGAEAWQRLDPATFIRRVQYEEATSIGKQHGRRKVIVAQKIKIIDPVTK